MMARLWSCWAQFWFAPVSPRGRHHAGRLGLVLLGGYIANFPDLVAMVGPNTGLSPSSRTAPTATGACRRVGTSCAARRAGWRDGGHRALHGGARGTGRGRRHAPRPDEPLLGEPRHDARRRPTAAPVYPLPAHGPLYAGLLRRCVDRTAARARPTRHGPDLRPPARAAPAVLAVLVVRARQGRGPRLAGRDGRLLRAAGGGVPALPGLADARDARRAPPALIAVSTWVALAWEGLFAHRPAPTDPGPDAARRPWRSAGISATLLVGLFSPATVWGYLAFLRPERLAAWGRARPPSPDR